MNNKQLLEPINFKSESIFSKNDLQITVDNSTNIVSLNQNREEPKKFKTLFKNYFLFEPPKKEANIGADIALDIDIGAEIALSRLLLLLICSYVIRMSTNALYRKSTLAPPW